MMVGIVPRGTIPGAQNLWAESVLEKLARDGPLFFRRSFTHLMQVNERDTMSTEAVEWT